MALSDRISFNCGIVLESFKHRGSFGKFNFDGNTLKDDDTITHQKPAISDKSYWKNCDLDNCVFLSPSHF